MLEKVVNSGLNKGFRMDFQEDWYNINKSSYNKYVRQLFPEYTFLEWKFNRVDDGFWTNIDNVKCYLKWLEQQLGWSKPEDWYNFDKKHLLPNYGSSVYRNFNRSIPSILYPEYDFKPWLFKTVNINYFKDIDNVKCYLKWLEQQFEWSKPEDWYNITANIIKYDGIIKININSLPELLYPEYDFKPWLFKTVKNNYFKDIENIRCYLKWLEQQLGWSKPEDWYDITGRILKNNYGSNVYKIMKTLINIVNLIYPDYEWDVNKLYRISKSQEMLQKIVKNVFPSNIILINDRSTLKNINKPKSHLELDIYLPELNLAFEYDGIQHYEEKYCWGDLKEVQERDLLKNKMCLESGIYLIRIPYYERAIKKYTLNQIEIFNKKTNRI